MLTQKEDFLLNCPYKDKSECKSFGGKWDKQKKRWYVPAGIDILKFTKWWKIEDHPELLTSISKLLVSYQSTQRSYADLQENLISLKTSYGELQESYAELLKKYRGLQIKQVGSNIKKTALATNSKEDNPTPKIDSIKHNSSDRESSNVQPSKFSGNGGYYKSVADRAAKAMNRKSLSPSFKRRHIEETWGTRDDWRRDKNSWKKKNI